MYSLDFWKKIPPFTSLGGVMAAAAGGGPMAHCVRQREIARLGVLTVLLLRGSIR